MLDDLRVGLSCDVFYQIGLMSEIVILKEQTCEFTDTVVLVNLLHAG